MQKQLESFGELDVYCRSQADSAQAEKLDMESGGALEGVSSVVNFEMAL